VEKARAAEEVKMSQDTEEKKFKKEDAKKNRQLQIRASDPIAKKIALTEHKRTLDRFDRFNEDYV